MNPRVEPKDGKSERAIGWQVMGNREWRLAVGGKSCRCVKQSFWISRVRPEDDRLE